MRFGSCGSGHGGIAVTDSEHITRILDGLSELGCGNHSCWFNPPRGIGTTGGCDCLMGGGEQCRSLAGWVVTSPFRPGTVG